MGTPKKRRIKRRILLEKRNQNENPNEVNHTEPIVLLIDSESHEVVKNNNEEPRSIPNGLTVLVSTEKANMSEPPSTVPQINITKKRKPKIKRNAPTKPTTSNTNTTKRRKTTKKVASNT